MPNPKGLHAWTVRVGEKGQIVIPKEARDLFNIRPGDSLLILGDEKRGLAIPPQSAFNQFTAALFNAVPADDPEDDEGGQA